MNCQLIREFGGIAVVRPAAVVVILMIIWQILSVMREHLTKERIQCNACSLLWKVPSSFRV